MAQHLQLSVMCSRRCLKTSIVQLGVCDTFVVRDHPSLRLSIKHRSSQTTPFSALVKELCWGKTQDTEIENLIWSRH